MCNEVSKQCTNNTDCRRLREKSFKECKNILYWDGNLPKPNCTDGCKKLMHSAGRQPIMKHMMCCKSDGNDSMNFTLIKRNLKTVCGAKIDSDCENKKKACEAIRAKEDNTGHTGSYIYRS